LKSTKSKTWRLALLASLAAVAASCQEEECDGPDDNRLELAFVGIDSAGQDVSRALPMPISFRALGGPDSLPYDQAEALGAASLPLSPTSDTTRWLATLGDQADTLTLVADRQLYLVSQACGFGTRHSLRSAQLSGSFFDSLLIVLPTVDDEYQTNLLLYFSVD